jgi:predicted ATPase
MKKITIKNFKCFEEQEIEFKNLTILAGANGSGKSTVIQSLLLLIQSQEEKNVFLDVLILNGYFINAGVAQEILYEEAVNDVVSFNVTFDDETSFLYDYSIENRNDRIIYSNDSKEFTHYINSAQDLKSMQEVKVPKELIQRIVQIKVEFANTDFISADRFGPKLQYKISNDDKRVGVYGEYTPYIINKHKGTILDNKLVYFNTETKNSSLLSEINNWLSYIVDGVRIDTEVFEQANLSLLKVTNYPPSVLDYKSPIHMPYGASYVLPVIASCLINSINSENGRVIIENPEAHLHPSAQSKLGEFFAIIANAGVQIVLETHSDHIINGIRIAIKNKKIKNSNVIFNSFSKGVKLGENIVEEILIDENGKLNKWPDGFFDQYENDMLELL